MEKKKIIHDEIIHEEYKDLKEAVEYYEEVKGSAEDCEMSEEEYKKRYEPITDSDFKGPEEDCRKNRKNRFGFNTILFDIRFKLLELAIATNSNLTNPNNNNGSSDKIIEDAKKYEDYLYS